MDSPLFWIPPNLRDKVPPPPPSVPCLCRDCQRNPELRGMGVLRPYVTHGNTLWLCETCFVLKEVTDFWINEAITAEEGARLTAHLKMAAASLRLGRLFSWSRPGLSSLD